MTLADSEGLRAEVASVLIMAGIRRVPDKLVREIISRVEHQANALPDGKTSAAWARCGQEDCGHVWPVIYLPMNATKAAIAMKQAACPMCGDTRPYCHVAPKAQVAHG